MKNIKKVLLRIILSFLIIGLVTAGIDYLRMSNGEVPIFNIQDFQKGSKIQTYRGLLYVAKRKVHASSVEALIDSSQISYQFLWLSLNVPKQYQDLPMEYTIETKEVTNCVEDSKLYYADMNIKVYTYCLEDIQIKSDGSAKSLLTYLAKDTTILDDIDSKLLYYGFVGNASILEFHSDTDTFTNFGLTMYRCSLTNINDVYIGPKNMSLQKDFCTYKDDDLKFIFEISDETPEGLESVKDAEGNTIPDIFFEDSEYYYEFEVPKSNYVFITTPEVRGKVATKTALKTILSMNLLTMEDLEKKGLNFQKVPKKS